MYKVKYEFRKIKNSDNQIERFVEWSKQVCSKYVGVVVKMVAQINKEKKQSMNTVHWTVLLIDDNNWLHAYDVKSTWFWFAVAPVLILMASINELILNCLYLLPRNVIRTMLSYRHFEEEALVRRPVVYPSNSIQFQTMIKSAIGNSRCAIKSNEPFVPDLKLEGEERKPFKLVSKSDSLLISLMIVRANFISRYQLC